ncbi:NLR family CARD domain-containing protein 4-like [Patiria miniata]|uniref:NACHT domain-containing protein n=1 Tax=Patiria miniata TaxID=46514 RepID=A0A913Z3D0_PATMI|nr:NLR family CARD domain-containing protein 4-like [Patiria miniata]XP_038045216.1 NLR family CARD domain-containing protein 4-like [Patiria miniata]
MGRAQSKAACRTAVPTTMQQEAPVPTPSAATDSPERTGAIRKIGTVSGSNNPTIVGSNVNFYSSPLDGAVVSPQTRKPDQESRVGDLNQEVGNKTRDILRKWYKTTGSYVQFNPEVPDDQRPIVGIYTKLRVRTKKGTAEEEYSEETVYSTEYEKILKDWPETGFNRAILFGIGGVGKSTIFDKIAYDWADEACEILKRFKLVFLLKMCALLQKSDLVDAVFDQLLGETPEVAKDELDKFIQANSNKVLILLDGFDEMRTKTLDAASFGSILKALNRKKYRKCCIFVSTRPSHFETLKSLVQNPCTHIEVLGFTKEDVNEYIRKFYYKDPISGNALIQSIEKSNTLLDLFTYPMLLLLMCLLWRENKQLPKTTSRLFTKAVDYMFTRKGCSYEDASKAVIAIGKTALSSFISADHNFSYQIDEFEQNALHLALKAGILTQQRVIKNLKCHNNIQFMHKTIQEFCAGKYLQSVHMSNQGFVKSEVYEVEPFSEFQNYLKQLCQTIEDIVSHDFLLRFCCGDNEKCMTDIVKLLEHKFEDRYTSTSRYQSSVAQAISRQCFFESQAKNVPQCLNSDSLIPSAIEVDNNNDFRILIYLLEIICRSDGLMAQLSRVETIKVSSVSLVSGLAVALGYMENLWCLTFCKCSSMKGDLEKILASLKCNQVLTNLHIDDCNTLGSRAVEWAPHIKHLTSLKRLEVRSCKLESTDIEHIASAVHDMPKLTYLRLDCNRTLGRSADLWAKELPRMMHLNKLNLSSCNLTRSDIPHIASAVGNMPKLTELELNGNDPLGGCAALWAKELPKMMHLNKLDLNYCDLTQSDIPHIASAVGDMPRLTELDLWGNKSLGGCAVLWAKELPKMMHLNKLVLRYCHLTQSDIPHIASAVGNMPRLTDLHLDGNDPLAGWAAFWAKELPKMMHLNKLDLSWCNLTRSDIPHIASAVGNMPRLTDLDLGNNWSLGGCAAVWAKELPNMMHLNKLDLYHCNLTHSDIPHIASAVGNMPRLTDLDLGNNWSLGGCAAVWAKELPNMMHLNKLNLYHCNLTHSDIPHIASAVGNMPRLTDLDLGSNKSLGGCAALWAKELPNMMHLNKLNLGWCNLTHSDIPHIASAVGNMPSLTRLSLFRNEALYRLELQSLFPSLSVEF